MKKLLNGLGGGSILAGGDNGGRDAARHFQGEGGAGEGDGRGARSLGPQNPAHGQAGFIFDALGDADQKAGEGRQAPGDGAESPRRDSDDHAAASLEGSFEIWLETPCPGNVNAGQVAFIPAGSLDLLKMFRIVTPERHLVLALMGNLRESGPPGAGSEHGHFHFCVSFGLEPTRLSVPLSRRWIFALCL